jgi:hypothetical protein
MLESFEMFRNWTSTEQNRGIGKMESSKRYERERERTKTNIREKNEWKKEEEEEEEEEKDQVAWNCPKY